VTPGKKICLVIPSLQAGGMERVMSELAKYFVQKEHLEIHLVLYGITREVFYPIPKGIVIHKPEFQFDNRYRLFHTLKTILFLRRIIISIKPDSVLSFGEIWNSFVLFSMVGLKYPTFISDRCSPMKEYSKFHHILRKMLYPRAHGIIAQTHQAKEVYSKQFHHSNIIVIGNPIHEMSAGNTGQRENIVLMVGRLIVSKNQDKLIEMFLRINMPGWKLVLVGYDHLQQSNFKRLESIVAQNNAESKVLLAGKQTDVENYYARSSIFAFTSSSEGFPNAIGEAMSAGLPVIAFDCVAGPSDMITDDKNGFLIPLNDYEMFQKKLEVLMKSADLRDTFGEDAKTSIKKFSLEIIGEQYLQLLTGNR
jgi:GalNAc-alpha-(1->4)-GalNAc-alpha-(1->3)-diNAcBac-PP-undecaprenol alpha-1,4-N-acetyl-D-galactosaminyltransferase